MMSCSVHTMWFIWKCGHHFKMFWVIHLTAVVLSTKVKSPTLQRSFSFAVSYLPDISFSYFKRTTETYEPSAMWTDNVSPRLHKIISGHSNMYGEQYTSHCYLNIISLMNNILIQIRDLRLYINLPLLKINIILRLSTIIQTFLTYNLNHHDLPSSTTLQSVSYVS
jgi:hypothetical protein